MGWTGLHRIPGTTDREFFEGEFPETLQKFGRIVACATKNGAFYAAVENNAEHPKSPGQTWAFVILVRRGRGYYNFHYKEMDENMGPAVDDAPAAVLDVLSPTDHKYATEWRQRCRDSLAAQAAARTLRATVADGDTIEYERELTFSGDRKVKRFRKDGTAWLAVRDDGVGMFRCRLGRDWATKHGPWTKVS